MEHGVAYFGNNIQVRTDQPIVDIDRHLFCQFVFEFQIPETLKKDVSKILFPFIFGDKAENSDEKDKDPVVYKDYQFHDTLSKCIKSCSSRSECQYWTYDKDHYRCYLKTSKSNVKKGPGFEQFVSGSKKCPKIPDNLNLQGDRRIRLETGQGRNFDIMPATFGADLDSLIVSDDSTKLEEANRRFRVKVTNNVIHPLACSSVITKPYR